MYSTPIYRPTIEELNEECSSLYNKCKYLQSKIDKAIELIEKEDLIRYFRETNDIELANEFEDLYKNLKEDK